MNRYFFFQKRIPHIRLWPFVFHYVSLATCCLPDLSLRRNSHPLFIGAQTDSRRTLLFPLLQWTGFTNARLPSA